LIPERSTNLVGCVLTFNEERHVKDVVRSLKQVTEKILVIDSDSSDRTREHAIEEGASVLVREFDSYATQRNWAIDQAIALHDPEWILFLDADERLPLSTAEEICGVVRQRKVSVYMIQRKLIFSGRILRFGGFSRTRLARLFQPGTGRWEARSVNEHFIADRSAKVGKLRNPIIHEDISSWERYVAKHNSYSTLEAGERLARKEHLGPTTTLRQVAGSPFLARRWMREAIFERLPAKAAFRFAYLYIVLGGFLDGAPGFKAALFQSWQELVTEEKYKELLRERQRGSASVE
jgi:glycosyltransferase involved in cell wall biosynthesis